MGTTAGTGQGEIVSVIEGESDYQMCSESARQQHHHRLELSVDRYRRLNDCTPDMYSTLDLQGNLVEFNARHIELLGYSEEELLNTHISCIMIEDMLPYLEQDLRDVIRFGNINGRDYILRKKDGSVLTVEVQTVRSDGPDGQPREVRCTMRDVTQRKRLEEQLVQSQKMDCVGQLAGGIAHDFNNLLTAITGCTQMALSATTTDPTLTGYLNQINQATQRATTLTRQLLAFSRRQIISPQVLNLNDVIASTEPMLRRLVTENIQMHFLLADDLGEVKMDPAQVQELLINLTVNARDAMPDGGMVTISTTNITVGSQEVHLYTELSPGPFVQLCVADTGTGMDEELQLRVFEPFFTTKQEVKGTGLGLSMCYGIMKQNNGHICVRSEPGRGSAFQVLIPQVNPTAVPVSRGEEKPEVAEVSETILLAEDDPLVRGMTSQVLRRQGYTVLEAEDGLEALEVSRQYSGEVQLLLTDVVMPNISVTELTERLKATRHDIKVLFTSGYTDDSIVRQGVLEPGVEFIGKPYSPDGLLERVRELLDR